MVVASGVRWRAGEKRDIFLRFSSFPVSVLMMFSFLGPGE